MDLLTQFLLRLSFGMALAMAITSPRQVTSGYFRNHLYVLLGLNVLAAVVAATHDQFALWPPAAAALLSYVGSVMWLYEKPWPGRLALAALSAVSITGAWMAGPAMGTLTVASVLVWLTPVASGLLLGVTIAAMFLGHWYLNTPTMRIEPLSRLVMLIFAAVALRAAIAGAGLGLEIAHAGLPEFRVQLMILLRWAAGLVGTAVLAWMTRQTLKIPNTQSATGILYVAVIVTFLGELVAMLLSSESNFPL